MASKISSFLIPLTMLSFLSAISVRCVELEVGGDDGWATPPAKNQLFYNDWASSNRFKVNDTLKFRYKKDSVLEVTQDEYEKCRSSHPMFFSNNGDTLFTLYRPGLFYFISGVSGHCERGLKMIVKVLDLGPLAPPANHPLSSPSSATSNVLAFGLIPVMVFVLLLLFTASEDPLSLFTASALV